MHVGDIDVMIDVYIYCLLQWNVKKLQFSGSLPSAMGKALGKDFSKKKILCRVPRRGTRQSIFLKKIQKFFAECLNRDTRQRNYLKKIKKTLPSIWAGALGKVFFKKNKKKLCRVPGLGHSAK